MIKCSALESDIPIVPASSLLTNGWLHKLYDLLSTVPWLWSGSNHCIYTLELLWEWNDRMHVKCLAWRLTFRTCPRYGSNCYHSHGLPEGAWSRPPPVLVLPHAVRKKDSWLSTNPQRLQPRLIGQRVPSLHKEQKWARDTGAPIQRSPSFHSEGLKSQLASDPQKLGFFLTESPDGSESTYACLALCPEVTSPRRLLFSSLVWTRSNSRFCLILQLHNVFLHPLLNIWFQKR